MKPVKIWFHFIYVISLCLDIVVHTGSDWLMWNKVGTWGWRILILLCHVRTFSRNAPGNDKMKLGDNHVARSGEGHLQPAKSLGQWKENRIRGSPRPCAPLSSWKCIDWRFEAIGRLSPLSLRSLFLVLYFRSSILNRSSLTLPVKLGLRITAQLLFAKSSFKR